MCRGTLIITRHRTGLFLLLLILAAVLGLREQGACATYGVKTADGGFSEKVRVSVDEKEITFTKIRPQERFQSIALKINKRNRNLVNNVRLLNVIWIGEQNRPGKPVAFAGPKYNPGTMTFKDSMSKSVGLKIRDTSTQNLFVKKPIEDLLQLEIDDQPCISSEAFHETDKVVTSKGKEVSISVDKASILFDQGNMSQGVVINIDNRTGGPQTLGVEPPDKDQDLLTYFGIGRRQEQTRIPRESWGRFTVEPGAGVFLSVIPEQDPQKRARLHDKEIRIFLYEGGGRGKLIKTIPIKLAPELRYSTEQDSQPRNDRNQPVDNSHPTKKQEGPERPQAASTASGAGGLWIWALQILNLVFLIGAASYGIFFVIPRMQVLEDRLAKNEMFIHGSREAIREELEQTKKEILNRCLPPTEPEIE